MRRRAILAVRLVFLGQFGLLPWMGLSLALEGIRAGSATADWAFFGSLGLATLLTGFWFVLRADPAALPVRLAFVLCDLVALVASGFWIWLTQGTDWLIQYAWGLLSLGFALVSLGILVSPGSRRRFGEGRGVLGRIIEEGTLQLRRRSLSRRKLFYDLSTLLLVAGLSANAWFAWNGYGERRGDADVGPLGIAQNLPSRGGDALLERLAEEGGFLHALLTPSMATAAASGPGPVEEVVPDSGGDDSPEGPVDAAAASEGPGGSGTEEGAAADHPGLDSRASTRLLFSLVDTLLF